ncbi:oxidoreductase [Novosphingobium soli]|uniref:Oxidoreductase n=1 Tax=Novosphingobium soli TaxID=574956 RepID=A0ABV6CSL7_9SPHN
MLVSDKKTALVTGASSGIGKTIAQRLIRDGYQVYAAARQIDKMADLRELGAQTLRMDISVEADIAAAVATILAQTDGVDVLINNAGFGLYGPMEEVGMDEARYQFEVNLFGPARLTQLLLPAMRARKGGRIVNITSMGGKIYTPLGSWYHATKHALEGWSDCLRIELAPFGIDVVVVEPGLIESGFADVVSEGLLKRSGSGPYAAMTRGVVEGTRNSYGRNSTTPARVIADVVGDAVAAKRPRTRYVKGKLAGTLITLRTWLGDRMFDRILMSQLR